jgi:ElaB/YqjD/DUF883 family membrane-anchored ribosome-binding protein
MENSGTGGFAKTGQTLTDKAADKVHSGTRVVHDTAKDAGNVLSTKLEDVRSEAGTVVKRFQSMGKQGLDAISDAVGQARDAASDASDSIISYTKENPVKALAIAAAAGALLYAAIKALIPSRD